MVKALVNKMRLPTWPKGLFGCDKNREDRKWGREDIRERVFGLFGWGGKLERFW